MIGGGNQGQVKAPTKHQHRPIDIGHRRLTDELGVGISSSGPVRKPVSAVAPMRTVPSTVSGTGSGFGQASRRWQGIP